MTGFLLSKLIKIIFIVGICAFLILICVNEIAARGMFPKTKLQQFKLDQITWQNTVKQFQFLTQKAPSPASQSAQVAQIWQQAGPQLSALKDRGLAAADVAKKFIQTQLFSSQSPTSASSSSTSATGQPTPTLAPLEQRTIDYAKYIYCKETVKSYETQHPDLAK